MVKFQGVRKIATCKGIRTLRFCVTAPFNCLNVHVNKKDSYPVIVFKVFKIYTSIEIVKADLQPDLLTRFKQGSRNLQLMSNEYFKVTGHLKRQ